MSKRYASGIEKVVPLACSLVLLLVACTKYFDVPDNRIYDTFLALKCRLHPVEQSPRIIGIDLTDNTELLMSVQLADRSVFLDALSVMKRAGISGGFDFLFAGAKDTENDRQIAALASGMGNCVFAVVPLTEEESGFSGKAMDVAEMASVRRQLWYPIVRNAGLIPRAKRFLLPYPALAGSAGALAQIEITADRDGVQRRVPLLYRWENGYIPSYPLEIAVRVLHIDTSEIVLDAGNVLELPLPDGRKIRIPVDKKGYTYIPYTGLWKDTGKHISLETFAAAAENEDRYWDMYDLTDGGIVLFSDLSTAKKDFGISPLEPVYPLSGIHYSVLNGILTDTFYRSMPFSYRGISAVAVFMLLAAAIYRKRSRDFHIICALTFICFSVVTAVLWFCFLVVPWYTGAAAAVLTGWAVSFLFRQISSMQKRILLEHALSRYFPRSLAARVLKEGKTDLVPVKKELTMLFSDIAGFTKWSSDKAPETVHAFLTEYLTSMAGIIFAHGGTVDKFIGDGMLAFFGDPFEQPDHAARAVASAVDMQKKIRILAGKWGPAVGIDLNVRIGINTGDVIVGNLGSDVRIDYTVIGAAVNLASRMESNAPAGGILASQTTYEKVKDLFPFSGPQPVCAKGYDRPVFAYVVMETYEV
jgi:adenylate cyclase